MSVSDIYLVQIKVFETYYRQQERIRLNFVPTVKSVNLRAIHHGIFHRQSNKRASETLTKEYETNNRFDFIWIAGGLRTDVDPVGGN